MSLMDSIYLHALLFRYPSSIFMPFYLVVPPPVCQSNSFPFIFVYPSMHFHASPSVDLSVYFFVSPYGWLGLTVLLYISRRIGPTGPAAVLLFSCLSLNVFFQGHCFLCHQLLQPSGFLSWMHHHSCLSNDHASGTSLKWLLTKWNCQVLHFPGT